MKVGRRLKRRLTIRNLGPGTLSGAVLAPFEPFKIVSGGGSFRLARGQRKVITLQFAPTEIGDFVDVLSVFSSDRFYPNVRVDLLGQAPE